MNRRLFQTWILPLTLGCLVLLTAFRIPGYLRKRAIDSLSKDGVVLQASAAKPGLVPRLFFGDSAIREFDSIVIAGCAEPEKLANNLWWIGAAKSVELSSCGRSDAIVAAISDFRDVERLAVLDCSLSEEAFSSIRHLRGLKRLVIADSELHGGYATLRELPLIKAISLSRTTSAGEVLRAAAQSNSVDSLSLTGVKLGRDEFASISQVKDLHALAISSSDVSWHEIEQLAVLRKLLIVSLDGSSLADLDLASIGKFSAIRLLVITNTRATESGVQQLKRMLPECEIISDFSVKRRSAKSPP